MTMKVGITCVHWLDKDWTLGPILVLKMGQTDLELSCLIDFNQTELEAKLKRFMHASGTLTGHFSRELAGCKAKSTGHFKIWKVMGHHVLKERHAKLKVKLKRFVHASGTFTGQFSRELNQQLHNLLIQFGLLVLKIKQELVLKIKQMNMLVQHSIYTTYI